MNKVRKLWHNTGGAAALEFALVSPLFILLLIGIVQVGIALFVNAGLRNGVESAARHAQVYPRPSDSEISAVLKANAFGLNTSLLVGPTLTYGTLNSQRYVDVAATYQYPINIPFMPSRSVNLSHSRRAYQY
jgi:Flp pilus assembly protein TadG